MPEKKATTLPVLRGARGGVQQSTPLAASAAPVRVLGPAQRQQARGARYMERAA